MEIQAAASQRPALPGDWSSSARGGEGGREGDHACDLQYVEHAGAGRGSVKEQAQIGNGRRSELLYTRVVESWSFGGEEA